MGAGPQMSQSEERKYPCPECETGELYDANEGGMFMAEIRCTNPTCKYEFDDSCGTVTA